MTREELFQRVRDHLAAELSVDADAIRRGQWEPCDESGGALEPMPTPEWKPPALASIYALTKFDQERLCLLTGEAYRIPTVAMRFFTLRDPV